MKQRHDLRKTVRKRNPKKQKREMSVPTTHQLAVARAVLRTPDALAAVLGGMTKDEARRLIAEARKRNPQCKTMSLLAQHNPSSHDILVQIMRNGRWHDVDSYSGEEGAKAVAHVLARAGFTARVIRK